MLISLANRGRRRNIEDGVIILHDLNQHTRWEIDFAVTPESISKRLSIMSVVNTQCYFVPINTPTKPVPTPFTFYTSCAMPEYKLAGSWSENVTELQLFL